MKFLSLSVVIVLPFFQISTLFAKPHTVGENRVVYGDDNRKDVYESTDALYRDLASSTAAMIENSNMTQMNLAETVKIVSKTLEQRGVCSDEKFAKQLTAASCSGFLVGEDLLVTAGHCVESMADCQNYSWVFDYAHLTSEVNKHEVDKNNVYKCVSIIERKLDRATRDDYALVKLDRSVHGKVPLKFRTQGKIADNTQLVVIGHPTGLPTKIADEAFVRTNRNSYYFVTNLDTFGGNSGSAVFDSKTGEVEGILVRGETDYERDSVKNCDRPKVCKMNECRGEDVTRITNISSLKTSN